MIPSAFEGLLVPERGRRKAARDGGFCVPVFQERPVDPTEGPFLVTNARRAFVQPVVSTGGVLRYGFSECSVEEEPILLAEFFRALWKMTVEQGWSNRCNSVQQARFLLEQFGLVPKTLIVPIYTLSRVCGQEISLDDARKLTLGQGYVAEVDGLRVLFSDLPEGQMIMATSPPMVGIYSRIDDRLGLVFHKVNQTVILINELAR